MTIRHPALAPKTLERQQHDVADEDGDTSEIVGYASASACKSLPSSPASSIAKAHRLAVTISVISS
jgi:hypothetical protein